MAWELTTEHTEARNLAAQAAASAASIANADAGAGPSTIKVYSAADPETEQRTLLTTLTLTKPCGTVVDRRIRLTQASAIGDLVLATGVPVYAEWCNGDGVAMSRCTVSPAAGTGDLKLSGREDGQIFAGGYVTLLPGLIG